MKANPKKQKSYSPLLWCDANDWFNSLERALPRQNGTPSQVEALKKSIERGKGL